MIKLFEMKDLASLCLNAILWRILIGLTKIKLFNHAGNSRLNIIFSKWLTQKGCDFNLLQIAIVFCAYFPSGIPLEYVGFN